MLQDTGTPSNDITSTTPTCMVLLHSAHDMQCSKRIYRNAENKLCMDDYGNEHLWHAEVYQFTDFHADIAKILADRDSNRIAIYGALIDEERRENIPRRKEGDGATIRACERQWLPVDIDGVVVDATLRDDKIEQLIADHFPEAFHGISVTYQMTSSYMLKGDNSHLRCRLWFELDRPVSTDLVRVYMREKVPVADYSIYTANQPIYIMPPQFDGMEDPVNLRVRHIPGILGPTISVEDLHLEDVEDLVRPDNQAFEMPDVEPDPVQIQAAIEKIMAQEPKGPRHPWMVGCCVELAALGADADTIVNVCDEIIRKEGREPGPGESQRALKFALGKLSTGQARVDHKPTSTVLTADEEAAAKLDAARLERELQAAAEIPVAEDDDMEDAIAHSIASDNSDVSNAIAFVHNQFGDDGYLRWRESDYRWNGQAWQELEVEEVEGMLARLAPHLTSAKRSNAITSMRQFYHRPGLDVPCRLTEGNWRASEEVPNIINVRNGTLYLDRAMAGRDDALQPHDKSIFTPTALPFNYDPAAKCPLFLKTMDQWFPADYESHREIQKILGYMLAAENPHQKFFVFTGESRAGKGCLCRIIKQMIGDRNVASPSLRSLGSEFGLMPLLGKRVCMIPEANTQSRRDLPQDTVDRIKAITGGDPVDVNRKYKGFLTTTLRAKILLTANQVPQFHDESAGLSNRMHLIHFQSSFAGREDITLEERLSAEMPGILNWALEGLRLLGEDGRFLPTESARELADDVRRTSSPVKAFIDDCIDLGDASSFVTVPLLYDAYRSWQADQGYTYQTSKPMFLRAVRSAAPNSMITKSKGRDRPGCVSGMKLNDQGRSLVGIDEEVLLDK